MMTAREIAIGKMVAVRALDLRPGDFVFYIGKWQGKVNAFIDEVMPIEDEKKIVIERVRVRLDTGEVSLIGPEDHVICCRSKVNMEEVPIP